MNSDLVTAMLPYSDMPQRSLLLLAHWFLIAHTRCPGGMSLEVGTRLGGSACLLLSSLNRIYGKEAPPLLFTVDPYGGKPYAEGQMYVRDPAGQILEARSDYGRGVYQYAKVMLAQFGNHIHWMMEGEKFLENIAGTTVWDQGEQHRIGNFSFALLDGDHTTAVVRRELDWLMPHMNPEGVIIVDNSTPEITAGYKVLAQNVGESSGDSSTALACERLAL